MMRPMIHCDECCSPHSLGDECPDVREFGRGAVPLSTAEERAEWWREHARIANKMTEHFFLSEYLCSMIFVRDRVRQAQ